jgi:hypothetical protein
MVNRPVHSLGRRQRRIQGAGPSSLFVSSFMMMWFVTKIAAQVGNHRVRSREGNGCDLFSLCIFSNSKFDPERGVLFHKGRVLLSFEWVWLT